MKLEEHVKDVLSYDEPGRVVEIDAWDVVRKGRKRLRRRATLRYVMLCVLLLAAGAGGWVAMPHGTSRITTATGGGPQASPTDKPAVVVAYENQLREWIGCLRRNGISVQMPKDEKGDDLLAQLRQYKTEQGYAAAQRCASLVPVITPELERAWGQEPSPTVSAAQVQGERKYAACMHRHGASDFPTPGANGIRPDQWNAWNRAADSAGAKAARDACGPFQFR